MSDIYVVIEKFFFYYEYYISMYDFKGGEDNKCCLIGYYEIVSWKNFLYGVVNCGVSVRIFCQCVEDGYGYLEDRRLVFNCDFYRVIEVIVKIIILGYD